MKNFFKKAAFVLALAMVLTNIGPAAKASAAEAPGLKYSSRVIYVGGSAFGDYTDNCWTPSKNTAGYKVAYEVTTGKDLITVAANGKVTATGNGIGKAVVKITYTPDGGGQAVTANFTVKVRRNASDVRLTNATIAKVEEALKVGDEIELIAAKSWTTPISYAKGNYGVDNYMSVVSDQITYKVSDENVIKVEGSKLTAVGTGTATLTVISYEYGDTTKSPTREKNYTITVVGGIMDINQISSTSIQIMMGQAVPDAKASDFTVTRVSDTADFGIKGISLSSDNKTVTIETYSAMNDGEKYTVNFGDYNFSFTATNGKVVSMRINKTVIPYNFATTIIVDLLDADGVVLASVKESTASDNDVEWTWTSIDGATYDDKLVLYSKNDSAELKVTYRPGNYDDAGNEIDVIGPQTYKIIAMDVAVDANLLATIANQPWDVCVYSWPSVAANGENRTVFAEETGKQLHVYITDASGNEITQNLFEDYGYYLESSNENILTIGGYSSHDHTEYSKEGHYVDDVGIYAEIYGVRAGTANVLIKNSEGKVVFTIKITVNAVKKFASFDLDKSSLTLSNTPNTKEYGSVFVTAKDQYGNATWVDNSGCISLEPAQEDTRVWPNYYISMNWGNGLNEIVFEGSGCDAGSYRYKVIFEKNGVTATRYITVVMKDYNNKGSDSYKVVIGGSTDSTYQSWATRNSTEIQIAHYKGGVLYEYLGYNSNSDIYVESLTVTNGKNQTTIEAVAGSVTGSVIQTGTDGTGSAGNRLGNVTSNIIDENGYITNPNVNKYTYPITTANSEYLNSKASGTVDGKQSGAIVGTITGAAIKKASTGTRSVKATIVDKDKTNKIIVNGSFTVVNYQESMTAIVDKTTVEVGTIEQMIKEALTFKHEGYKDINSGTEADNIVINRIKLNSNSASDRYGYEKVEPGDKIYVASVVIRYERNNNGDYIEYTVPVNRTITVK